MYRRVIGMLLAAVILFGCICTMAPSVSAASDMKASEDCISFIKKLEGFSKYPYYDYGQWTVGYGTACPSEDRARYDRDGITEAEADALLREYVAEFEADLNKFVSSNSLKLKQCQFDALLSFTYNLGPNWMNNSSTFRTAVLKQKTGNDFIFAIGRWCTADGEVLSHLIKRRLAEANMYLNGAYSTTPPSNYKYVIYETNLEDAVTDVRVQAFDAKLGDSIRATATKSGYTFLGWFTAETGGKQVTALNSDTSVDTLYAHWEQKAADEDKENEDVPDNTEPPADAVIVTVTGEEVNVRSGPGTSHNKVGTVIRGEKLAITETEKVGSALWGKFDRGWISLVYTDYDSVIATKDQDPDKVTATGVVNTKKLNVRGGAGTDYPIVDYLYQGDKVVITLQQKVGSAVWGKVSQGWISMKYVDLVDFEPEEDEKPEDDKEEPVVPETPQQPEPPVEENKPEVIATGTVVNCTTLRIRSGPGTKYDQVGSLPKGTRVSIYAKTTVKGQVWGQIDQGWICMTGYVQEDSGVSGSGTVGTVVKCKELNVRAGAGTDYAKVGKLAKGTKVMILETTQVNGANWGRIDMGWVHMYYIELGGTMDEGDTNTGSNSGNSGSGNTGSETEKPAAPSEVMYGVVSGTDTLRVREAPGTDYKQVGTLKRGDRVKILETTKVGRATWGRIDKGWISLYYVELDEDVAGTTKTVNTKSLNIRSGPGTNNAKVGTYEKGEKVKILETTMVGSTLWGRTDRGWISLDYVI
ncbi:MAG: SH3 domain-containing protein [Oscillospiraceae bacterium]|nr:SH3 domain-containing protein [Oscillospiraceae bacterium]